MDGWWEPVQSVGGAGLVCAIVYVIAHLLRSNREDRAQQAGLVSKVEDIYKEDLNDLRGQVEALRERCDELEKKYEEERRLRWKAEDAAAYYRRLAGVTDDDRGAHGSLPASGAEPAT